MGTEVPSRRAHGNVRVHARRGTLALVKRLVSLATALLALVAAPALADDGYHIHAGDQLSVVVYGDTSLTQTVKVLPGGAIAYPLIGEVSLDGLTPTQASDRIASKLSKFIRKPNVTVAVAIEGPIEVLVLGNVKTPGKYELRSRSHLTDALASAGGLGITDGDLPVARLSTDGGVVKEASLQGLLHAGDVTQNVELSDKTTVYVPSPLTLNVQVLGAVDHPGDVVVREGDRLSMALARAGNGVNSNADLNHITIRRLHADGSPETMSVNLYDVLKNGDVAKDIVMQKNDLVYVPQAGGHSDRTSGPLGILFSLRHLVGLP